MPKTKYHAIAAIDPSEVQKERIECYHESTTIVDQKTKQEILCHYLFIGYRYPAVDDGSGRIVHDKVGRLILTPLRDGEDGEPETWDSWGLGQYDPNQVKFTISFNLWNSRTESRGGSEEKQRWFDAYKNVLEMLKEVVVEHREEIGQEELEIPDLRLKFGGYNKAKDKTTKKVDPTRPEFIRLKVPAFADKETREVRFIPEFYEFGEDQPYPQPLDLLKKQMEIRPTIYIESVFSNSAWTVPQLFLHDAEFGLTERGSRRMISASSRTPQVRASEVAGASRSAVDVSSLGNTNAFQLLHDDSGDEGDEKKDDPPQQPEQPEEKVDDSAALSGEESGDEEAEEPVAPPPAPAATLRSRRQPARRRRPGAPPAASDE